MEASLQINSALHHQDHFEPVWTLSVIHLSEMEAVRSAELLALTILAQKEIHLILCACQ